MSAVGFVTLPQSVPVPIELQDGAACAGSELEFFPEPSRSMGWLPCLEQRALCAACPVIQACLRHAMRHEGYGIWGGLTESERFAFGGRRPYTVSDTNPAVVRQRAVTACASVGLDIKAALNEALLDKDKPTAATPPARKGHPYV